MKVPEEKRVLRRIRALRGKDRSLRSIADKLNAEVIPSPRGKAWNPVTVRALTA